MAIVVNNLDVGGLEKVAMSLLRRLDPTRIETHLVCLEGEGAMFADQPLPRSHTLVLHKKPRQFGPISVDLRLLWNLRQWLRSRRIEVVHAHNFAPMFYAGIAASAAWGPLVGRPRMVYTEHNQVYSATDSTLRLFRRYVRLADDVIAVSEDLKKTLRGPKVGLGNNVSVIYNGIDGTRFQEGSDDAVRRELGVSDSELLVGTGVVLSKQKAIGNLVSAASHVIAAVPNTTFIVAGDGPLRAALEAQAASLGLGNRFRFLGYRSDMHKVISALDVYVLPSLWEGLPLALLEGLAMKKFIVCSDVGGNAEIVQDGENGIVIPPGDVDALSQALTRALIDPALRHRAHSVNREKFDRLFSEDAMVAAHEKLYLEPH